MVRFIHEAPSKAKNMLVLAKCDLGIARIGKISDDICYQGLITLCQQATEKSLKSLMIHHNVPYPREHSIDILIDEMEKQQIILPENIKASALAFVTIEGGFSFLLTTPINFGTAIPLSEYAKDRGYSLSKKPLEEQEYQNVLARCKKVVEWVENEIQNR